MDILEKMERRIPCGEDFSIELEAHEFAGIPESRSPVKNTDKERDESQGGIIKSLMRDCLFFFRDNQHLEVALKAAKQTEKSLRLRLVKKEYEIERLQKKINLFEYEIERLQKKNP